MCNWGPAESPWLLFCPAKRQFHSCPVKYTSRSKEHLNWISLILIDSFSKSYQLLMHILHPLHWLNCVSLCGLLKREQLTGKVSKKGELHEQWGQVPYLVVPTKQPPPPPPPTPTLFTWWTQKASLEKTYLTFWCPYIISELWKLKIVCWITSDMESIY